MLFEVAILEIPTQKEIEGNGAMERLLFGPVAVVARDEKGAVMQATRQMEHEEPWDASRVQVLVRPFVQQPPR